MSNIIFAKISQSAACLGSFASSTKNYAKKGMYQVSQTLNDFQSDTGAMEKACCFGIALLKFKEIDNGLLHILKLQKEWFYATKSVGSFANYFDGNKNFKLPTVKRFNEPVFAPGAQPANALLAISPIKALLKKVYSKVCLEKDYFKIFMDVGSVLQTAKFIQKNNIYSFTRCKLVASRVGNWQVFGKQLNKVPVLQSAFDTPKDLFIIAASSISLIRRVVSLFEKTPLDTNGNEPVTIRNNAWNLGNLLGIVGDVGRLSMVVLGRYYGDQRFFVYIELATRTAGVAKFILDRHMERANQ
jgi:hypothetical protein